jgi:hypothetical protein
MMMMKEQHPQNRLQWLRYDELSICYRYVIEYVIDRMIARMMASCIHNMILIIRME